MSFWPTGMSFLDLIESWSKRDSKKVCRGVILIWNLWTRRNELILNGKEMYHAMIVDRVFRLAADCCTYASKIYGGIKKNSYSSQKIWKVPPEGTVKVNCDVSLCVDGRVGLGVVARDWKGDVLFAVTSRTRAHWAPIIAEVNATSLAIRLAKQHGLSDIIIEADNQVLINRLCKASIFFTDLDSIIDYILSSCVYFYNVI
ncbi:uncharacterized protein LOC110737630 [Chenopodium quinoa]|uniref:uncharacterized protein LOC110737630 n=1 Tax=Chenopodium quinoa TaxID=63459 RepID=UPI000B771FCC|nr:uncharacterized protein LOC110737630 [Chenopodium quinoa]